MQYLLDTNICIALIKGHPGIRAKILTIGLENCFVPDISIAELYYGAAKIDDFDLLIGAIAKQSSLILVTHNTRHFSHIPELMIEDWRS